MGIVITVRMPWAKPLQIRGQRCPLHCMDGFPQWGWFLQCSKAGVYNYLLYFLMIFSAEIVRVVCRGVKRGWDMAAKKATRLIPVWCQGGVQDGFEMWEVIRMNCRNHLGNKNLLQAKIK